jgi:hypothetical protein
MTAKQAGSASQQFLTVELIRRGLIGLALGTLANCGRGRRTIFAKRWRWPVIEQKRIPDGLSPGILLAVQRFGSLQCATGKSLPQRQRDSLARRDRFL